MSIKTRLGNQTPTQAIIDDAVKANAEFQYKAGLK